eukprot:5418846-Pleurochrysis_carterae.AAC.1
MHGHIAPGKHAWMRVIPRTRANIHAPLPFRARTRHHRLFSHVRPLSPFDPSQHTLSPCSRSVSMTSGFILHPCPTSPLLSILTILFAIAPGKSREACDDAALVFFFFSA